MYIGYSKKMTFIILMTIIFASASLISFGVVDTPNAMLDKLRYFIIFPCVFLLIVLFRKAQWQIAKSQYLLLTVWMMYSLLTIISSAFHGDTSIFFKGIWLFLGVPGIFFIAIPNILGALGNQVIAVSLIFSHLPYLVACFIASPILSYPYRGIMSNPNQVGMISITIATGAFILLHSIKLNKKTALMASANICILLTSLFFIVISNSRTSLIAFIINLLIWMVASLLKSPSRRSVKDFLLKLGFLVLPIFLLLANPIALNMIMLSLQQMVDKFSTAQSNYDALSGRSEVWQDAISQPTFFGHSNQYFETKFGISSHNSVIQILGENGAFAAIAIAVFGLISILCAIIYFNRYNRFSDYAITPLFISSTFWALSMGEVMLGSLGRGIALAYFLAIGIMVVDQQDTSTDSIGNQYSVSTDEFYVS
jgi:hypothetical protein